MARAEITHRPLSSILLENLEPEAAEYRKRVGQRLYLRVKPNGRKTWELRYKSSEGRWSWLHLGLYPKLGVEKAKAKARRIHAALGRGAELKEFQAARISFQTANLQKKDRRFPQKGAGNLVAVRQRGEIQSHLIPKALAPLVKKSVVLRGWVDPKYVQISKKDAAFVLGVSSSEFDRLRRTDILCPKGFRNHTGRGAKVRFRLEDIYKYSEARVRQAAASGIEERLSASDQTIEAKNDSGMDASLTRLQRVVEEWFALKAKEGWSKSRLDGFRSVLDAGLLSWIEKTLMKGRWMDPEFVQVTMKVAALILAVSPTEFSRLRREDPDCPRGFYDKRPKGVQLRFKLADVYRYSSVRMRNGKASEIQSEQGKIG